MRTTQRWVDARLLDLWSVAVLQTVGIVTAVVAAAALDRTRAGATMLALFAVFYTLVGTALYVRVGVAFLQHRRGPAFDFVVGHRRTGLTRWLCYDGVLVTAPWIVALWVRVLN